MNILSQILDLTDEKSSVTDYREEGNTKYVTAEKNLFPHFCPKCGFKMYSKGIHKRHPTHQVLQDGYALDLTLKSRQ